MEVPARPGFREDSCFARKRRTVLILLFSLLWVLGSPAFGAAVQGESESETAQQEPAFAIVMIHNRPIAVFRTAAEGNIQRRALLAEKRIDRILSRKKIGKVTTRDIPEGVVVLIGGEEALLITQGDLNGESRQEAEQRAVRNLKLAIEEVEEMRDPRFLLEAGVKALLATIFFLVVIWWINRFFEASRSRASRLLEKWKLNLRGFPIIEIVIHFLELLLKFAGWILAFFATYIWLSFCLRQFPPTRALGESLRSYFFSALGTIGSAIIRAIPNLVVVLVIFVFTHLLVRMVKALFTAVEQGQVSFLGLDPYLAKPTRRIVSWVLWVFAIIMAYPYMPGSGTVAFEGMSILVGVLVSLGSTNIVGQAMGGLVLTYSKAFKPGDFIQVGQVEVTGTVLSLGVLSTRLKTVRQEEISIPNAVLLTNTVTNYTRLSHLGLTLNTVVTIGYNVPWRKVHKLLLMAAERTPEILKNPPPFVQEVALSDFYIEYQLTVVTTNQENPGVTLSALNANIQDMFNEYGEQIMSPHYMMDPSQKVWVPKEKWHEPPAGPDDEKP
jgi:small-conductance mechanosensitive channel